MITERVVRSLEPPTSEGRANNRILSAAADDFRPMLPDLTTIQIREAGASEAR